MNALRLLPLALLHLFSKKRLDRWLARALCVPPYTFRTAFSGRVALYVVARHIRARSDAPVALVPNYICNVVPRAVEAAGWTTETYDSNRVLEPDWSALARRIARRDVGLLVGASVFGSSGLLDVLEDSSAIELLRTNGVHVIVDLAQDVRLARRMSRAAHDIAYGILSFNDKSFPGVMGGAILAAQPVEHATRTLTFAQHAQLYRTLARKVVKHHVAPLVRRGRKAVRQAYEYSLCSDYPFQIEGHVYEPAKLQSALAVMGVWSLDATRRRKLELLRFGAHVPTRFAETAAYLAMDPERVALLGAERERRAQKAPYALHRQPETSLHPEQLILHNKGFADRRWD